MGKLDAACPVPEGAPTLKAELARGVNPYNLRYGAVAAVLLGAGLGSAATTLPGVNPWTVGLGSTAALFVLLTLIHTFAHGALGWVFEVGLQAHCRGEYRRAARWLALAERPGMDHYDPHGVALAALKNSRTKR